MTYASVLTTAVRRLRHFSDSPALDAELLLAHALNSDRPTIICHPQSEIGRPAAFKFQRLVERRRRHIPIAYLIGQQEFYGLPLIINRNVLVPRPCTEMLVSAIIDHYSDGQGLTILDLGTGSGAIALALAQYLPRAKIIAIDKSAGALRVAKLNSRRLKLSGRIIFRRCSLASLPKRRITGDIIVANLPYLKPSQLAAPSIRHEPRLALAGGPDGWLYIKQLIDVAKNMPVLAALVLECDPGQVQSLRRMLRASWPSARIINLHDGRVTRGFAVWIN